MTTGDVDDGQASPCQAIDAKIAALGDCRGETLVQALIREADPEVVETVKWRKPSNPAGVPVWEHDGIICTGGVFKDKVKLTFAHGAALPDPAGVFNNGFGAASGGRSICAKARRSTWKLSRRWSGRRWR